MSPVPNRQVPNRAKPLVSKKIVAKRPFKLINPVVQKKKASALKNAIKKFVIKRKIAARSRLEKSLLSAYGKENLSVVSAQDRIALLEDKIRENNKLFRETKNPALANAYRQNARADMQKVKMLKQHINRTIKEVKR
jgi:hypothetical protein